jgi:VanZ family protein
VPFGFLAFMAFDSPPRTRRRTYGFTLGAAALFAVALAIWQQFLPTRVTVPTDLLANGLGALLGAVGGHLRKELHIRFDH